MKSYKSKYSGLEIDNAVAKASKSILTINGISPDENGNLNIEEGGTSTVVVDVLPEHGDPSIDYVLKSGTAYIHYKWIEDKWHVISGSLTYVGTALPETSSANELTDYYIQSADNASLYIHYRFINGKFTTIGGTGSTGGGSSSGSNLKVTRITQSPVITTPNNKVEISFSYSSTDSDGETIDGMYTFKYGTTVIASGPLNQGVNTVDVTDYLFIGTQKFSLSVVDDAGNTDVKTWTVQVVDIRLETDFNDRVPYVAGEPVSFTYKPIGSINKTVHFILDGVELESVDTTTSGVQQSYVLPAQSHGAHLLKCYITAEINNTFIETEPIYKDIIWFDESVNTPVISCIYRNDYYGKVKVKQHDSITIPYMVYSDFEGVSTSSVTINIDGNETIKELTTYHDNILYRAVLDGYRSISIKCGDSVVEILMDVEKLDIDVTPVTANLAFDFNPTGLSNSNVNRLWADSNNPDINMTVSDNFDWSNGGYQIDNDGNQYFCVKSGTTATINYNLFEKDPKTNGSSFKVIFKTANVKNIQATFLSCQSDDTVVGFEMKAHEAYLKSSIDSLFIPYSEEDIIELEYNIEKLNTEDSDATSVILSYEDGTPFRPMVYDATHRLHQYNPVPITIGSPDCDVYIYRMKAYTSSLSNDDILSNFIADARDSSDIMSRYKRNQIYNENNMITPESVAIACPDLKIIKLDCPFFTQDKNEFIKDTIIEVIHKNGDPTLDNFRAVNCYHSGQGTTSNEYGDAGRNIDVLMCFDGVYKNKKINNGVADPNYKTILTMGDGTTYEDGTGKITLTRTSVPNNYFNIKVNIASSENANNALLQKRYNDFLPYRSKATQNNPNVKNTMEFVNCVIFVRENNEDLTTHREFNDTEWHFYALGNIGDSKKTDVSRVNDPNDPKEFVVEIADNTLPNSIFDTGIFDSDGNMVYPISKDQWVPGNVKYDALYNRWEGEDDSTYEFRYEYDNITDQQHEANIQIWRDMYEWVITSTDEEFINGLDRWFIKDSALYFYLFTERYTMIDNRAKNTFWHYAKVFDTPQFDGDDGYRFDFWDYDNDTSLGINNSGEMSMTYGKEDIDYRIDGVPSSGYIYNGANSVFFRRIRNLMHNNLVAMYQSREDAGAWNANSLITEFDNYQSQFPEILWKLDFERKYYRTYKGISHDNSIVKAPNARFLRFMMNGRKKYHRRQFERDQNKYMGTKYITNSIKSDQIMFRCNTPSGVVVAPNYTLEVIPYSDMYITTLFGNSGSPVQIRAKAGNTYKIDCPLATMDNTAVLIYCASRIQALNDLSACYIEDNDFSKAVKLQKLVIGNDTEGYSNMFLSKLILGNNALLEELDIRNCPNLVGSINLSNCSNLRNLYATGTAITGVVFAVNGKIESAYLPDTITSLSMVNLIYLTDLNVSYDNLEDLTIENSIVNTLSIMNEANDTIKDLRLVGINWTLTDTKLLNQMLEINTSYVAGSVNITGAIRNQELLRYAEAWPDLKVTYKPENIVPQHLITYVNADGNNTVLYEEWVDQNGVPSDPYALGKIDKPTLESDEQYNYSFGTEINGEYSVGSGWDNITDPVFEARTVVAVYSKTIRTYTVSWHSDENTEALYSVTTEYGKSATFAGNINRAIEDIHLFKLFIGWDKSTGFIRGDTKVYAVWDSKTLPVPGTELKDMSPAEIYAVIKSGKTDEYFTDKDYVDITLGHDYDFENVESEIITENEYFDGARAITTEHKLFGAYEKSFTIAIDLRFMDGNTNATILSCFENNNNNGFRIRLSGNAINIQWGDTNTSVSFKGYRDMIVLRHRAGEQQMYVYTSTAHNSSSESLSKNFNLDSAFGSGKPRRIVLTSTNTVTTEFPLTLGAVRYADGSHSFYGTGIVYWCKIWFDDIGNDNCEQLASWHHESLRMEYYGSQKYLLSNTGISCNASFIANNLLEDRSITLKLNNNIATNWSTAVARTFLHERVLPALPVAWQAIIKQVNIDSSPSSTSGTESVYTDDYIYLPSESELRGGIAFMESDTARVKFDRFIIPNTANYYTSSTDPQTDTDIDVQIGDIWTVSSVTYILVGTDEIDRYKLTVKEGTSITSKGGWVASAMYWTRTVSGGYTTTNYAKAVLQNGTINDTYVNTTNVKLCVCFSI